MYTVWTLALACLIGRLLWKGLERSGLSRPLRILLMLLGTVLISALIYVGSIYLSIFLFQWSDPVTW